MKQEVKRNTAMRTSRIQKQIRGFTDQQLKDSIRNAKKRISSTHQTYKEDIRRAEAYRKQHAEYSVKFLPLAKVELSKRKKKT